MIYSLRGICSRDFFRQILCATRRQEMSSVTPYLALGIFPLAFLLAFSFNPPALRWVIGLALQDRPFVPVSKSPPVVRKKAAAFKRYAYFLGDGIIVGLVAVLMATAGSVDEYLRCWCIFGRALGCLMYCQSHGCGAHSNSVCCDDPDCLRGAALWIRFLGSPRRSRLGAWVRVAVSPLPVIDSPVPFPLHRELGHFLLAPMLAALRHTGSAWPRFRRLS